LCERLTTGKDGDNLERHVRANVESVGDVQGNYLMTLEKTSAKGKAMISILLKL